MLLYDCVLSSSQFLSIDKFSKNVNVSQLGMDRNPTTPLSSDTTKRENIFDEKIKNVKIRKRFHAYKCYASNSLNCSLKILNLLLK